MVAKSISHPRNPGMRIPLLPTNNGFHWFQTGAGVRPQYGSMASIDSRSLGTGSGSQNRPCSDPTDCHGVRGPWSDPSSSSPPPSICGGYHLAAGFLTWKLAEGGSTGEANELMPRQLRIILIWLRSASGVEGHLITFRRQHPAWLAASEFTEH